MSGSNSATPIRAIVGEPTFRYFGHEVMPDVRLVCPRCNAVYHETADIDGRLVCVCVNYHIWSGE
jgi:hypothetical protein